MLILGIFGGICLVLGIFFMLEQKDLKKLEAFLNKPLVKSEGLGLKYSKVMGIVLIVLSCVMLYIGWSLKR